MYAKLRTRAYSLLYSRTLRVWCICGAVSLAPDADHLFPSWAGIRPAHMAILVVAGYFACYSCTRIGRLLLGQVLERGNNEQASNKG